MNLSFKNRIALYYMVATAVGILFVFIFIFFSVEKTVFQNLDRVLAFEAKKHTIEIQVNSDSIYFINKAEWEEIEHREVQVNPVFIQIISKNGELMDKSPNLKSLHLPFNTKITDGDHFTTQLNNIAIRQIQVPIKKNNKIIGYMMAAMSLKAANIVMAKLKNVLWILYPTILLSLFFTSRYLAGRSITPIKIITETTNRITKNNLSERISLPINKDELYHLTTSINALLERIESAISRERQFTSDASHELRTPLATLRGTLEILVRKPRTTEEYQHKITSSLDEVDRMSTTIDQLLLLARLGTVADNTKNTSIALTTVLTDVLSRYDNLVTTKKIKINVDALFEIKINASPFYVDLLLDNIISNAIKYSKECGNIYIKLSKNKQQVVLIIEDEGIGIKTVDMKQIYNPFFRSDALQHKAIKGNGLGLSIAKKSADVIEAVVDITSKLKKGTTVTINFKST